MSKRQARWLAVLAVALVISAVAGRWAIRVAEAGGAACRASEEFADSLASNRARLAAVDSALALFDYSKVVSLPDTLSPAGSAGPNRLERRIIEYRRMGVTAPQVTRWLSTDLHLKPRAAGASGDDPVAKVRRFEGDSAYVAYLHRTLQSTFDYWHDMSALPKLAAQWQGRCAEFRGGWLGRLQHLTNRRQ